jgi:acyl-homoserine-lactone acylase
MVFGNHRTRRLFLAGLIWCSSLITAVAAESLADQVVIRRDSYGVPHVFAKTEKAAGFGLGYAQAEDHCVEIARRYIAARGESAKHLGSGADSDFLAHLEREYHP